MHLIDSGGLYGAEVMLLSLVEEQIKLGLYPIIASIGEKHIGEKPLETEAIQRGFQVEKFRMTPGPNLLGALKILRYAKKHRIDLLHSHGYKGNILLGFIPKRFRRIPMISTLHGYTSTTGLTKMRIYEWLDLFSHRFMDKVVLVNKGMLTNPKLKNQHQIHYHIINNGIPVNPTNPSNPSNSTNPKNPSNPINHVCQGRFVIGSIGRFSTEKGYRYLIEAFSILVEKGVDAYLVLIGEGYEDKLLKQMVINLKLSERVLFPGYLKDAGNYITLFSIYVISSLTEGLPITLLEAMRAKTPIVASNVGGIPEVLKKGALGRLVPLCDNNELADSILHVHRHYQEAKEMAMKAYSHFIEKYSATNMANRYIHLYYQVMTKK